MQAWYVIIAEFSFLGSGNKLRPGKVATLAVLVEDYHE